VLGLYLHIPFCRSICSYCNFNRGLFDPDLKTRYVEALVSEIAREGAGEAADTIYFGGGTPSLLEPDELARLIRACGSAYRLAPDAEITIEANPDDVTDERLIGWRAAGINRVSFGVQSFLDRELERLDRRHSAAQARRAVQMAHAAGFDNVSVDLMLWLPDQTPADARASVSVLTELAPAHASIYLLELYPNAPLQEELARARWSLAPDEDAALMYEETMAALETAGYEPYEISNVARPGKRSRHNLKYWTDAEWSGFGCGAHSTRNGVRSQRVAAVAEYLDRVARGIGTDTERRVLTSDERLEEALFTGLRLVEGVDVDALGARYGVDVRARYGEALEPHVEAGLVAFDGGRLTLTPRGRLLANEVMSVFV
jgi:oxygen-independent coproporphyrinogen-3 oxidase